MTNTSAHPITVDGVRLDTLAYNIEAVTWRTPPVRSGMVSVPGVHGVLPSYEDDYEDAGVVLSMIVLGHDVDGVATADPSATLQEHLDALLHLFSARHRLLDVQRTMSPGVIRQAWCARTEGIEPEVSVGRVARLKVALTVVEGFWRDPTSTDWSQAAPVSGTAYEVTTLQGATAPVQDGRVLVTGPAVGPVVTDVTTGATCALSGTLAAGEKWFIDAGSFASRIGTGLTLASAATDGTDAIATTTWSRPSRMLTLTGALDTGARRTKVSLTASGLTGASAIGVRAVRRYL